MHLANLRKMFFFEKLLFQALVLFEVEERFELGGSPRIVDLDFRVGLVLTPLLESRGFLDTEVDRKAQSPALGVELAAIGTGAE